MSQCLSKLAGHWSTPPVSLEAQLREETKIFAQIWLLVAKECSEPKIARPLPSTTFDYHWLFKNKTDVKFYEIKRGDATPECTTRLDRALLTWETCLISTYVIFKRVKQHLTSLPEVRNVEWVGVVPNPRIVIAREGSYPNHEVLSEHDCIMITAVDGSKYVLDVTAWQFGYGDYFFSWEMYKEEYVVEGRPVQFRVPDQEFKFVDNQYPESGANKITQEFLHRKQDWVTYATDAELKEAAGNISLSF